MSSPISDIVVDINLEPYLGGQYISGSDVEDGLFLTVSNIEEVTFKDGTTKPVLSFVGEDRQASLGPKNVRRLITGFGNHTSQWIGRTVLLSQGEQYEGKPTLVMTPQAVQTQSASNGTHA